MQNMMIICSLSTFWTQEFVGIQDITGDIDVSGYSAALSETLPVDQVRCFRLCIIGLILRDKIASGTY
jgi:hypothetical protein